MTGLDEELTELLKGKIIDRISVEAFPDIFIFFDDGTSLYYEFDTLTMTQTDGDEKNLLIRVSDNNKKDVFRDKIDRIYRRRHDWI